jgi:ATP-dependent helicase/nuclease subunit A
MSIPEKPAGLLVTDSQWEAIHYHDNNLLVSASAGSGKTKVLIDRIISRVINDPEVNVDNLLVVTFTEAAAAEMKERLKSELEKQVASNPELLKQINLIPKANISTIHAFCSEVIREFYYLIGIDPQFRVMIEDSEITLLKEEVYNTALEEKLDDLYELADNFTGDKNDNELRDLVYAIYNYSRSQAEPIKWIENLSNLYDITQGLEKTELYTKYIVPTYTDLFEKIHQTQEACELAFMNVEYDHDPEMEEVLSEEIADVHEVYLKFVKDNDFYGMLDLLQKIKFAPGNRKPMTALNKKIEGVPLYDEVKKARNQMKKNIDKLQQQFYLNAEELQTLMATSLNLTRDLTDLALSFYNKYQEKKTELEVIDFDDMMFFAFEILKTPEASQFYQAKFAEVLTDEYQDVNRLQDAILNQLSRGNNRFMVGDIKQSIYAFRLAEPKLFNVYYDNYNHNEEAGKLIRLKENFRSRKEVLDFTNLIFMQLMDKDFGMIDYVNDSHELVFGFNKFPQSQNFNTEILLNKALDKDEEAFFETGYETEHHIIAQKIRELIDTGFQVFDKKQNDFRKLKYEDIVILTRAKSEHKNLANVLSEYNIKTEITDDASYFSTVEMMTMLSLLQIIDNSYQDIPLAAVLRSPIADFDEDDLAQVRTTLKEGKFFDALLASRTKLPKAQKFLEQLDEWRDYAKYNSIADLVWKIYEDTAYPDYVGGLNHGAQRQANLYALADRAMSFEAMDYRGLYQFVNFIERSINKKKDLANAQSEKPTDVVKIMTIHKSKGLEFPIVFVTNLDKKYNERDLANRYLFDQEIGVGIQVVERNKDYVAKHKSLPFNVIANIRKKAMREEELRVLYVALTRAEQKLFLVGTSKGFEEDTRDTLQIDPSIREDLNSSLKVILAALQAHRSAPDGGNQKIKEVLNHEADFVLNCYEQEQVFDNYQRRDEIETSEPIEHPTITGLNETVEQALKILDFKYEYEDATITATYQSVSEMKRVFEDPDNIEMRGRFVQEQLAQPKFLNKETNEKVEASTIGTATHLVMQRLDFNNPQPEQLIEQLVKDNIIEENVAKLINIANIKTFLASDFAGLIAQNAQRLTREASFAMLMRANEHGDDVLIHGIVDGLLEFDDHVILFDYKTDKGTPEQIKAKHTAQMRLYKEAIEASLGKKVRTTKLVMLTAGTTLDV